MVSSVTSTTSSTSSTTSASSSYSASYDMFLQLLTTQLQTQNPLDPMDSTEFTSQLATYSQLEQQIATNEKLDSVLTQFDTLSMSTGVGYIGRTVEAEGDTITISDDGTVDASWKYQLSDEAKTVKLTVLDADGNTVWSGSGETAAGTHDFAWDGKTSSGTAAPEGEYTLKITATDAEGADVTTSTLVKGEVTAVDSSSGGTVLELGDTLIYLTSVTRLSA